jgi:hypothetical protein
VLVLAACARNSPALPPDLGHLPPDQRLLAGDSDSPEAKLNCAELKEEAERTRAAARQFEGTIAANRGQNQAIVYFSGLLPPLALAARNDEEAKKSLDGLQVRSDRLDRLSKAKGCGTTGWMASN